MTTTNSELSKTYSPKEIEARWYDEWEKGKYFKPKAGKKGETFSIIMPPPNVTGKLHMGHALDNIAQDVLIRYKRMAGFETLWLPGMDHAGIATQSVVEQKVWKEEKKTRHDFSREEFLKRIWAWKEEFGGTINNQLKALGVSCDWDYFTFTMDQRANDAVRKVFVDLYNEGLIYQADYIVNWDTELQSAISDAEVEHKEVQGAFYHILYPVKDSDIKLEIATTRPETMLGDTAVAVNPNDDRFKHLIGKTAILPIVNKEIPIIGDEHVDVEVGTGCLKVTPGHDFNDFEIGKRHNLEVVNILNKDGSLNENAGAYQGKGCIEARKEIVEELKSLNLYVKQEEHMHQVGHGQRSGEIIEPRISKQWFLNVQDMAKVAVDAVKNEDTKFYPKQWENTYFAWLNEPKNWCISRQLWWGHQIPVFYCDDCDHTWASEEDPKACPKCSGAKFKQDPDVLDTWFSSGLWQLTTLGWPHKNLMKEKGFDRFFPGSVLVTGFDIIFFWVARMMMMTLKAENSIPFEKIYIHAIVRDKNGVKMSKSLGNGIDPIDMIEEYGIDALRFTLAAGSGYNRTLNLDPDRIAGYRNYINKIWNAFRFIHPFLGEAGTELPETTKLNLHEKWILSELNDVTKMMNHSIDEFRFDEACSDIYSFVYDRFCSWFIELSKPILHGDDEAAKTQRATVLRYCFREILALLHPFTPYITEELWIEVKSENEPLLIGHDYPEFKEELMFDRERVQMSQIIDTVTQIRNLRSSMNIKPKEEVTVHLFTDHEDVLANFGDHKKDFAELAKVKEMTFSKKDADRPKKSVMGATTFAEIFLPLEGVIDLNEQIARIKKDITKTEKEYTKFEKKLSNPKFVDNAPDEVIAEVKEKASKFKEKLESLQENLKMFE